MNDSNPRAPLRRWQLQHLARQLAGVTALASAPWLRAQPTATPETPARLAEARALRDRGEFEAALQRCDRAEEAADAAGCARLAAELELMHQRPQAAWQRLRGLPTQADAAADRERLGLLAAALTRLDRHAEAAPALHALGRVGPARRADALAAGPAWRLEGADAGAVADRIELPFVRSEPLPMLRLTVAGPAGEAEANLLLDTGAADLVLDPAFAQRLGIEDLGSEVGLFGGGGRARVGHGVATELQLPGWRLRGVPVHLLPTARFAAAAGGEAVHGVLGTALLLRFRATLDYARQRLVLRRPGQAWGWREPRHELPMWLAGEHLILVNGRIGRAPPGLLLLDSGLAGLAFTAPESTIAESGAKPVGEAFQGVGGAGAVRVQPLQVESIALGPLERRDQSGVAGAFPAALERRFGFRIAGLVSHAFLRGWAVSPDFERMRLVVETG